MNPAQHLHAWVAGEGAQGRVMLAAGLLLSLAFILILKSENVLLRGTLVPLAVLVAMNLGYGGVLTARPSTSLKTEAAYRQEPTQTLQRELDKARADEKYYASARPAW